MGIEKTIQDLTSALDRNTAALTGEPQPERPTEEPAKTETAAQKKARVKAEKAAAKKKAAKGSGKGPTLDAVKKQARAAAMAVAPKQNACMVQIKALVTQIATEHLDNPDASLDDFDEGALILFKEYLDEFVFDDGSSSAADDLSI